MPITKTLIIPAPGTPYDTVRHGFRGGLNNSVSDEQISPEECSAVENYIPDLIGAGEVIKREGLTLSSSVKTEAWTSIHQGKNANYATTSTTINNLAGSELANSLTSSTTPDWATMLDNDIFVNGTDVKTTTDGATFGNLGGSPPTFKYLEAHNNFLFGAGHSLGILRWADLGTVATWTATNALNITTDEGNDITGLAKFRNVLIVFCQNSFHHVNGFSTVEMAVTHSAYGIGCTSHRSIVVTPFAIFWWSDAGLVMSRDGFETSIAFPSAAKIPGTLNGLNKGKYSVVHGVWDPLNRRVQYWVHNGSAQATFNLRIDYYYDERVTAVQTTQFVQGTFWTHTGRAAQMGASGSILVSGACRVYVGMDATAASYLYYQDMASNTDGGDAISAFVETARVTPVNPSAIKKLKRIALQTVLSGRATIDYGIYLDNSISLDKNWTVSLLGTEGFILDTDMLDIGELGSGVIGAEDEFNWSTTFVKIKHRISDSNALRTKLRGITHDGFLVHA